MLSCPSPHRIFCALPVAVDFDDGGVDQGVFQVGLVRAGVEQPLPDLRLHPVAKAREDAVPVPERGRQDRKSTRLNSSHMSISYAVFCLKKKNSLGKAGWWRGSLGGKDGI